MDKAMEILGVALDLMEGSGVSKEDCSSAIYNLFLATASVNLESNKSNRLVIENEEVRVVVDVKV